MYPSTYIRKLRDIWQSLLIPEAGTLRGHYIRRGATREAEAQGHSVEFICSQGRWTSPAFQSYLNLQISQQNAAEQMWDAELVPHPKRIKTSTIDTASPESAPESDSEPLTVTSDSSMSDSEE